MPGKKTGFNRFGKKIDVPQTKKRQRRRGNGRANADKVQAQGTGKAVSMAFGNIRARARCWDAFHPSHLPLPRAVGPYTTIRTTSVISSGTGLTIFGTFQKQTAGGAPKWSNICAVSPFGAMTTTVDLPDGTFGHVGTAPGGTSDTGFTCCPSAFSVQILNPNALQTTNGIGFMGACPVQLALGGNTGTWQGIADQFTAYMAPRMVSAGKLALRGVQIDSYPLNMNAISSFQGLVANAEGQQFTWLGDTSSGPNSLNPVGWAPIVVYNPSNVALNYLVCTEWRVRFDIDNPAVSSHTHHPVASDKEWDAHIKRALSMGHGVVDIVERVANSGAAIAAAGKGLGML
jgi:hypothetical protein